MNNNKLREALENSNELLYELARLGEWHESAKGQIAENKAALSAPPRNCDVGTAEEQGERFLEFCEKNTDKYRQCLKSCPANGCGDSALCEFVWSQMPYKKEGEE